MKEFVVTETRERIAIASELLGNLIVGKLVCCTVGYRVRYV